MKKSIIKTWEKPDCNKGALPITKKELIDIGITEKQIAAGEMRGEMKTIGPWRIPVSYRSVCMSIVYNRETWQTKTENVTMYGFRTMNKIHQSGYEIDGWVSIHGKKVSCFSSSQLFELETGELINIAIIHARIRKGEE